MTRSFLEGGLGESDDEPCGPSIKLDDPEALNTVLSCFRELQKTKMLLFFSATALYVVAFAVAVFAPEGRETLARCVGLIFLVLGVAVEVYSHIWLKVDVLEIRDHRRGD